MAINCWEFKNCGREIGGKNVAEFGVCPAATETRIDKINDGKNGGRACWAVVGTLCGGKIQGSFSNKINTCMNCDFYKTVWREENKPDRTYTTPADILRILK